MNINYQKYALIFSFIFILSACSDFPVVKSSSEDRVIVTGAANRFVAAYEKAKKECAKYERYPKYVPDETMGLKQTAFDCIDPNAGVENETTDETVTENEPQPETAVEETQPVEEITTEEVPAN